MVTEARPLQAGEYNETAMIPNDELDLVAPLSREETARDIRQLAKLTDRIILYHPDPKNPSSVYIVPMNPQERRFAVNNLLTVQREYNGKMGRWNFAKPQVDPVALPLRCFIDGCQRRGGFATRAALIAHVNGKHGLEAPMYQRLIDALMQQIYKDISPEQYAMFGIEPPDETDTVPMAQPAGRSKRGG